MCDKRRYTKREADAALKNMPRYQYRKECRAYPCPDCGQAWHLTSIPDRSGSVEIINNENFNRYINDTDNRFA